MVVNTWSITGWLRSSRALDALKKRVNWVNRIQLLKYKECGWVKFSKKIFSSRFVTSFLQIFSNLCEQNKYFQELVKPQNVGVFGMSTFCVITSQLPHYFFSLSIRCPWHHLQSCSTPLLNSFELLVFILWPYQFYSTF